jgi:hypothetical protein
MSDAAVGTSGTIDVSKYMYQIRKLKGALATASTERDAARVERDKLKAEHEQMQVKVEASSNNKRVQELERQIREIEFRKVFDRVARSKGIREDAVDAAYQLGGYRPPDGEVDESTLGQALEEQKAKQSFLTAASQAAAEKQPERTVKPGPASGQGGAAGGGQGFVLPADTDARWSDPAWQWNHQKEIAAAIREKIANGQV